VIEILNRYLTEMSGAILDHGGTLVTYMGDGIMAVFGSPLERPDHADAALATAREMLAVRLVRFNDWLRREGFPDGFRMGIGLNSGPVMSGNVGSERRLEYAAVGDTTNVAARLEAMTKETGQQLLVAESTRSLLREANGLVDLGERALAGRAASVRVWTLAEARHASEEAETLGAAGVVRHVI
jgi:adenylate cyclase